jgi:hypothetical protein
LYKEYRKDEVPGVVNFLFPRLMTFVQEEPDAEAVASLFELVSEVLQGGPDNCVDPAHSQHAHDVVRAITATSIERRNEIVELRNKTEEEAPEHEQLDEEEDIEDTLMSSASECTGWMLKRIPSFRPIFHGELLQHLMPSLLLPNASPVENRSGLQMLIAYVESECDEMKPVFLTAANEFLRFSAHKHPDLVQVAFFGLGAAIEHGKKMGADVTEVSRAAVEKMRMFFAEHPPGPFQNDNPESVYEEAKTNILSTALKILEFAPQAIDEGVLWQTIGNYLPCKGEDDEEGQLVHEKLLRWVKGENPSVSSNPELCAGIVAKLKLAHRKMLNEKTREELQKM